MTWQTIDSAPKDGTWILAVVKGFVPAVCRWTTLYREAGSFEYADAESFAEPSHFEEYIDCSDPWEPTHWMPLPEFPK